MVVVNWNRRDYLDACLRSLAAQTFREFDVIVVDNGSNDDSVEVARRHGAQVILNPENRGFCAANNQGIAASKSPWIALLNNDAEIGRAHV